MSTNYSTIPFSVETVQNRASGRFSKRLVSARRTGEENRDAVADSQSLSKVEVLAQQLQVKSSQLELVQQQLAKSKLEFVEFTNAISHDLQAPLRAVSGFSQYLKEEYADQLEETGKNYIGFVVDGASRMEKLIKALVQYSRVKSKALTDEIVDLNELFHDALMELRKQNGDSDAVVTCDELPNIRGDFGQLTFLMRSLIENGLKFNNSANPTIHIGSQELEGSWCISVQDNGIGIANENLKCVFDVFRQLHPQHEFDGVGAGLAICQRIAEHHGGNISIESAEGTGTRVSISLPIVDPGRDA